MLANPAGLPAVNQYKAQRFRLRKIAGNGLAALFRPTNYSVDRLVQLPTRRLGFLRQRVHLIHHLVELERHSDLRWAAVGMAAYGLQMIIRATPT